MTDTSKRELIEEAAKAIYDASWQGFEGEVFSDVYARIAFKVFEQAHTPSDDEREAARAYADAEYPELRLAPENEDRADIAERAFLAGAGFRRTAVQEPSAEPTDAQVLAASREFEWVWNENIDSFDPEQHDASTYIQEAMRAALQAAAAVREEGQGR